MAELCNGKQSVRKFQFQDGSIKWASLVWDIADLVKFQFQDGSIKWEKRDAEELKRRCFNSKMVRLNEYQ